MEENLKQQASSIIKIVIFGTLSPEKQLLTQQLAHHFQTVWTAAFSETYLSEKFIKEKQICQPEDLLPIAIGQTKIENETLNTANNFLFCNYSLLEIKIFSEQNFNFCDPILEKAAQKHKYDLFILADFQNNNSIAIFKKALIESQKPFIILSGKEDEILTQAIAAVEILQNAHNMGFSSQDFVQIYNHGVALEAIENQINILNKGIPKTILERAATINDGILKLTEPKWQKYIDLFETEKSKNKLCKFVPASGAASRMFKFLLAFMKDYEDGKETINGYINRKKADDLSLFLVGLNQFPFYKKVIASLEQTHSDYKTFSQNSQDYLFIAMLLSSEHFDFSNKPKGILPFHDYKSHLATPIEEHLSESVHYANSNGNANVHFTISEAHQIDFETIIQNNKRFIENEFETKINIAFSYQNKNTDTIAVDVENNPIRDEHGNLIFRPAGHGALIQNLNKIEADIIFIKNIDNVIHDQFETIAFYKKGLAGILIDLQQKLFAYLYNMEHYRLVENDIKDILHFLTNNLNIEIGEDFDKFTFENKVIYLQQALNKPIRVCGMVKNEGEPGGGPFWVLDAHCKSSLQIVESAQIDLHCEYQLEILKSATHFNPVDLVCGTKSYKGEKFDLSEFVDNKSGFIVEKTKNGKHLKGYELPGLWNGAMAKWITIFVQVPLITFNPVKTVNDLLKPAHQSK